MTEQHPEQIVPDEAADATETDADAADEAEA